MKPPDPQEHLRRLFDAGHLLSLPQMQQALGIGERQVRRLLHQLRKDGLPIQESRKGRQKLFALSAERQQANLPDLYFDQAELRALAVAAKASHAMLIGTHHAAALSRAFGKLLERARPVTYIFDLEEPLQEWHFEENSPDTISCDCFQLLETAMDERRSVRIEYQKGGDLSVSHSRKINPYFFAKRGRAWLVVAYCHQRQDLRNFSVMNIKKAELCNPDTEDSFFDFPPDLRPEEYFSGALGTMNSGKCYELRLLVEPEKALYFRQRTYHQTQLTEEERADGRLVVSFELEGFEEMRSFCQGWGAGITVLAPPELRKRLWKEALIIEERYREK